MTFRRILKGALTQLPIELYELIVRGPSRRPLPPVDFTNRDHFPHRGVRLEWWYFTSVLVTPKRKAPVGLEVTFFRVKTLVDSVIVHVAVTDVDGQKFPATGLVWPWNTRSPSEPKRLFPLSATGGGSARVTVVLSSMHA